MNPLDQLRDLHLPPEPGLWPPAPGWWILAVLIAIAIFLASRLYVQHHRQNRYRRTALAQLQLLEHQDNMLSDILVLVRRVAKTTNHRSTWPGMSSNALLKQLDIANKGELSRAWGNDWNSLATNLYKPGRAKLNETQRLALMKYVARWIRKHRRQSLC